jgi:hypothetical protein
LFIFVISKIKNKNTMEIKKQLPSDYKAIQAWVAKHEGQYYRISQGIRPRRPNETWINKCIVSGRVRDWMASEVWVTRTMDKEAAFNEYLASLEAQKNTSIEE